jgi:hypothetical protein
MNRIHVSKALVLLSVAGMALAGITGCTTKVVTAPGATAVNTVTASGSGTVSATPDEATMNFGVNTRSQNAQTALDQASAAAKKIVDALDKQGVEKVDIQTSGVSLYPQQEFSGGKTVVTGYEANISVSVKVLDLAKIGDIIGAASGAGANTISGPGFGIHADAEFRAQAIEKAVADARSNAAAMAKAAGKSVGEVLSISSSNVSVPGPLFDKAYLDGRADVTAESVPVEAGQLDVMADVTVIFELK